jgi:hypothetical protein
MAIPGSKMTGGSANRELPMFPRQDEIERQDI